MEVDPSPIEVETIFIVVVGCSLSFCRFLLRWSMFVQEIGGSCSFDPHFILSFRGELALVEVEFEMVFWEDKCFKLPLVPQDFFSCQLPISGWESGCVGSVFIQKIWL